MFDPAASSLAVVNVPRLPVSQFMSVRSLVDPLVACPPEEQSGGGIASEKVVPSTSRLIRVPTRPVELTGVERQTAVELLRVLLTEAVTALTSNSAASKKQEAVNE